jgi:hypothetical protein
MAKRLVWLVAVAMTTACGARTGLDLPGESLTPPPDPTGTVTPPPPPPPLELICPTSNDDPRLPRIEPEGITELDARAFIVGGAQSLRWSLVEEDCEAIVPHAGYLLSDPGEPVARFQPSRPSPYRFRLQVTGLDGKVETCEFTLPVQGRGMRIELCWDTSTSTDLDLYLHTPFNRDPWFTPGTFDVIGGIDSTTCNVANCTAETRFGKAPPVWGYPDSPLSACAAGPNANDFRALGRCPNPRAGDDNNQSIASGTTERIQLDNPRSGEHFRVMAQNFSDGEAAPHVFVYCGGERAGFAEPPPFPPRFRVDSNQGFGVMWRALDITTLMDVDGRTRCQVTPLGAPDFGVTINDSRF